MQEKLAEIVRILDEADAIFRQLGEVHEEARTLWNVGIEKLAGAIWLCERKTGEDEPELSGQQQKITP